MSVMSVKQAKKVRPWQEIQIFASKSRVGGVELQTRSCLFQLPLYPSGHNSTKFFILLAHWCKTLQRLWLRSIFLYFFFLASSLRPLAVFELCRHPRRAGAERSSEYQMKMFCASDTRDCVCPSCKSSLCLFSF